jgi:putative acyl-CoA dehydrogenase
VLDQQGRLAGAITVTLQAALLVQHAPGPVADAFCASRLSPGTLSGPGVPFGTLPDGLATGDVLGRATPAHR